MASYASVNLVYPAWGDVLLADYFGRSDLGRFWGDDREEPDFLEGDGIWTHPAYTEAYQSEARWGAHEMEDVLEKLRIPYDTVWGDLEGEGGGETLVRFENGEKREWTRTSENDSEKLGGIVAAWIRDGESAAMEKLAELIREDGWDLPPAYQVPPTPEQIDRIIELLTGEEETERECAMAA